MTSNCMPEQGRIHLQTENEGLAQRRRKHTKDNLGRRTNRVKRREARLMQNRANEGYDLTEIAKEFGRDPRTIKAHLGLRVSAEPKEK